MICASENAVHHMTNFYVLYFFLYIGQFCIYITDLLINLWNYEMAG